MINILIVEDDPKLNQLVCTALKETGYETTGCLSASEAYDKMVDGSFDMVISDIMMPDVDGFAFAEAIRRENKTIPILFMSARDDFAAKQKGFRLGIDDYMVKPVNLDELKLRIGALLRRSNIAKEKKLQIGNFKIDTDEMTAYLDKTEIPLTVKEFQILFKLLSYPKKTFTRAQLMDEFRGEDRSLRSVDVYITKLREKFATCTGFEIVTVHGLGYKAVLK
jgi:DNA-binding response OmpR family regulator